MSLLRSFCMKCPRNCHFLVVSMGSEHQLCHMYMSPLCFLSWQKSVEIIQCFWLFEFSEWKRWQSSWLTVQSLIFFRSLIRSIFCSLAKSLLFDLTQHFFYFSLSHSILHLSFSASSNLFETLCSCWCVGNSFLIFFSQFHSVTPVSLPHSFFSAILLVLLLAVNEAAPASAPPSYSDWMEIVSIPIVIVCVSVQCDVLA